MTEFQRLGAVEAAHERFNRACPRRAIHGHARRENLLGASYSEPIQRLVQVMRGDGGCLRRSPKHWSVLRSPRLDFLDRPGPEASIAASLSAKVLPSGGAPTSTARSMIFTSSRMLAFSLASLGWRSGRPLLARSDNERFYRRKTETGGLAFSRKIYRASAGSRARCAAACKALMRTFTRLLARAPPRRATATGFRSGRAVR